MAHRVAHLYLLLIGKRNIKMLSEVFLFLVLFKVLCALKCIVKNVHVL